MATLMKVIGQTANSRIEANMNMQTVMYLWVFMIKASRSVARSISRTAESALENGKAASSSLARTSTREDASIIQQYLTKRSTLLTATCMVQRPHSAWFHLAESR